MKSARQIALLPLAVAGLGLFAGTASAIDNNMTVNTEGGFYIYNSEDNNYWFKIGGRLHFDHAQFFEGNADSFPNGSNLRRAKLGFKGGVGKGWVYKLDVNLKSNKLFGDHSFINEAEIGEAFLAYKGCPNFDIAFGHITPPYSLENWTSSDNISFMEVAAPIAAFAPDNGLGAYFEYRWPKASLALAVYNPDDSRSQTQSIRNSDPVGMGGRLTYTPISSDVTVWHLGTSARYQELNNDDNDHRFTAKPEIRTRAVPGLRSYDAQNKTRGYNVFGFETAVQYINWLFSAEAVTAQEKLFSTESDDFDSLRYDGYYVSASWLVTGERRPYSVGTGTFGDVHPNSPKGAYEVALRHSYVNLSGARAVSEAQVSVDPETGNPTQTATAFLGSSHSTVASFIYHMNHHVRFLANVAKVTYPDERDFTVAGVRAQVSW